MTKTPTSRRATLEFLSSLKVHMFPNPSSGESSITFRFFNEDHTWTLEKFNEALGIPFGGPRVTPQHWNEKELWRTISVELDYDSKRSSVTSIRHPTLRYVFKVFFNAIFGRQEGSKRIQNDEDEIPSPEQMTLRNRANWSFNSSMSVHVPLLPEPSMSAPPPPYDGDPLRLRRPHHIVHHCIILLTRSWPTKE
ncbi:Dynein 78 kDa intermediate chain flagellar outer arm [Bienertia sinuspersici]